MKPLQVALDSGKYALLQGSLDILMDFRQLLDDNLELLVKLRDVYIDWVQGGFQDFFTSLEDLFLSVSRGTCDGKLPLTEKLQTDKVSTGLVLVLAQLSVFIEHTAIPKITEEIAVGFSGGGARSYEDGPAFIPAEICRMFRILICKHANFHCWLRKVWQHQIGLSIRSLGMFACLWICFFKS